MAPEVGFEPTTNRLTADRSTTELLWNVSVGSAESHPTEENWLRGLDLNQRPSGYEPDELPGCSTPRDNYGEMMRGSKLKADLKTGKPNGESQSRAANSYPKNFHFFHKFHGSGIESSAKWRTQPMRVLIADDQPGVGNT